MYCLSRAVVTSFKKYCFRILIITKSEFVRYQLGETTLMIILSIGSVTLTSIDSVIYQSGNSYGRVAFNGCLGRSHEFQVGHDPFYHS